MTVADHIDKNAEIRNYVNVSNVWSTDRITEIHFDERLLNDCKGETCFFVHIGSKC